MRHSLPQAFLGVVLLTVGVVAFLGHLGVVDVTLGALVSTWWPMVVLALGLSALLSAPRAWLVPLVLITLGVLLQLGQLGLVQVRVWELLLPTVIMVAGILLLTRLSPSREDAPTVNAAVLWWGASRRTRSQDFRGANLTAVMGGIDLDLRSAEIVRRADVSVFVLWAGVDIKVPPTWRVEVTGLPVLGGWEDKTLTPPDPHAPLLVVHVTAVMGGVEVSSPAPRT
ncbi:transmembrane protein [Cellulomonas bogoriensis 69B4 = DSM 16987]|uniref:Transmembrane protein n=1 Tax=Cellulomonas bogoriensis 69B4 = DSM 16987 TaxID=1386082 RepID=A0A0A0BSD7_9CELL|nr:transmembrane protein [Cellulomonas bogoriensis 69B4 = DSM 16987]